MAGKSSAAPIAWSARLAITMVRGLPGSLARHRSTLRALGLRRRHRTVFRHNTPSIRGMINQVKRHLAVETEEMYRARLQREADLRALRPPIVITHAQPKPQKPKPVVRQVNSEKGAETELSASGKVGEGRLPFETVPSSSSL
eukprot:c20495_g1_i4 orf=56-484(+)